MIPTRFWTADPKRTVFRDAAKRSLTAGGLGSVGEKAADGDCRFSRARTCSPITAPAARM